MGPPITSASLSPDEHTLLVACLDSSLRLLDLKDGKELRIYRYGAATPDASAASSRSSSPPFSHVQKQYPLRCCTTASGAYAVCGSEDGSIHYWDIVDASMKRELVHISTEKKDMQYYGRGSNGNEAARYRRVVSAIACHPKPRSSCTLSSGFDGVVKVWS